MHTSCNLKNSQPIKILWTFHVTQSYKCGYNRRQHRHSLGKPTLHHSWQPWKKIGWYDEKWVSWTEVWKKKTKRWFVYYNPTSTSNLIKIRLVEAILNKATQDLATSFRGHLRLTLSFANEITAVKILTGSSDMSFFSPKKPVCPKCSKQSL